MIHSLLRGGVVVCCLLVHSVLVAQLPLPCLVRCVNNLPATPPPSAVRAERWAVGVNLGSKALVGLDVAYQHTDRLSFRAGFNFMRFSLPDLSVNSGIATGFAAEHDGQALPAYYFVTADVDYRQSHVEALAEYRLTRWGLKAVGGVGYFPANRLSLKLGLKDGYLLNDVFLTPEEIGYGTGTVTFRSGLAPYLGMGLGPGVSIRKRVSFSMDLGAYYKGRPEVAIEATQLLRNNTRNGAFLTEFFSDFRWLPVLSARMSIRLDTFRRPWSHLSKTFKSIPYNHVLKLHLP